MSAPPCPGPWPAPCCTYDHTPPPPDAGVAVGHLRLLPLGRLSACRRRGGRPAARGLRELAAPGPRPPAQEEISPVLRGGDAGAGAGAPGCRGQGADQGPARL